MCFLFPLATLARGRRSAPPYWHVSRRMTDVALSVALPRNLGVGNQLTWANGTCTVTEMGLPNAAVPGGSGVTWTEVA